MKKLTLFLVLFLLGCEQAPLNIQQSNITKSTEVKSIKEIAIAGFKCEVNGGIPRLNVIGSQEFLQCYKNKFS